MCCLFQKGQHNYLCAGRNDCIIDKIRRKNCPACRFRKCLQAGMNLEARKNKKMIKMKIQQTSATPLDGQSNGGGGGGGGGGGMGQPSNNSNNNNRGVPNGGLPMALIPSSMPQLVPTMLSLLKAIEPEVVYSGYDSTLPDTSTRLMTTLNRLGGQQVISAVKWAKSLPGPEVSRGSVRMKDPEIPTIKERLGKRAQSGSRDERTNSQPKRLGANDFYQVSLKLLGLHICFYTFVNKSLSVEFPEMLAEIITNQIPKIKDGTVKPLLFHLK
ncbi:hypothetical protein CRUP_007814 [Coryphaenoides rupestris]|nr:hypothetical protein CRUP_007814 [Coryphaenoides rupestris]